jgi:prophage antirepressor-like protein
VNQDLTIYKFKENPVRTIRDDKGEPWWIAKDVCNILGLGDVRKAMKRLDLDECTLNTVVDSAGKQQEMYIVNEVGLYRLILRSNKPQAKEFQRWVTHEVLPSIRKTGSYSIKPGEDLSGLISTAKDLVLTMKALVSSYHPRNPFEMAEYYKRYMLDCGLNQTELAQRFGVTQGEVANTLRLLELPDKVRFMIVCGELSETHGRYLLQLNGNPALIVELARASIKKSMTVAELDAVIKQILPASKGVRKC